MAKKDKTQPSENGVRRLSMHKQDPDSHEYAKFNGNGKADLETHRKLLYKYTKFMH